MWLGEQITERGIGNGISMLILSGIVAGLPGAVGNTAEAVSTGSMSGQFAAMLILVVLGVTYFVVFVERAQRRIPVNYAKRQVGRRMFAGQNSHLPFKLNMAGVIPPIFASSILLFPATIANFFGSSTSGKAGEILQKVANSLGVWPARAPGGVRRTDPVLLLLLYGAGIQLTGYRAEPAEVRSVHPWYPPRSADGRVHRQGALAPDSVGCSVCGGRVPAAGIPGVIPGRSVPVRRHPR